MVIKTPVKIFIVVCYYGVINNVAIGMCWLLFAITIVHIFLDTQSHE